MIILYRVCGRRCRSVENRPDGKILGHFTKPKVGTVVHFEVCEKREAVLLLSEGKPPFPTSLPSCPANE